MSEILSPNPRQQPHDLSPDEHEFDPACLYIHDSGRCYCGAHVGVEATYTPQAWSCLGLGPSYTYQDHGRTFTLACEMCFPRGFRVAS